MNPLGMVFCVGEQEMQPDPTRKIGPFRGKIRLVLPPILDNEEKEDKSKTGLGMPTLTEPNIELK